MQHFGGFQYHGGIRIHVGDHFEYRGGCSVLWGDIIIFRYLSTLGRHHDTCWGISRVPCGMFSNVEDITKYFVQGVCLTCFGT